MCTRNKRVHLRLHNVVGQCVAELGVPLQALVELVGEHAILIVLGFFSLGRQLGHESGALSAKLAQRLVEVRVARADLRRASLQCAADLVALVAPAARGGRMALGGVEGVCFGIQSGCSTK